MQESGLQCSSDLVVTVPVIPRRIGLVLGHNTLYVFVYILCVFACLCMSVSVCEYVTTYTCVSVSPLFSSLPLSSANLKQRLNSESGNSKVSSSTKSPRATEGATATNPTVTAVGQPCSQKLIKPSKAGDQTGCIVYSVSHTPITDI